MGSKTKYFEDLWTTFIVQRHSHSQLELPTMLNGTPMQVGPKTLETCKYFYLQALYGCSVITYATEVVFASNLSFAGQCHVGLLFANEGRVS